MVYLSAKSSRRVVNKPAQFSSLSWVRIERLAAALPLPIQLKQSAATFAKVFKSGCFECSPVVVSPD